jgi:ribosomal protein L15
MPVDLNSPVWIDPQRLDVVSRCLTRLAKRFKAQQVQAMVAGPHTGVNYKKAGAEGFQRFHRASARGERPAPDTTNLINSVEDLKLASLQHAVYVDDAKAPYGKWLQDPDVLDRPIATKADAEAFMQSPEAKNELNKAKNELSNGITGETL